MGGEPTARKTELAGALENLGDEELAERCGGCCGVL